MAAPVPDRRRKPPTRSRPARPPEAGDAATPAEEPPDSPPPLVMPLPAGIDPAALEGAWFDLVTEHEAEREVKEIKVRTDWVMREARQRKAYELRIMARLPYRTIAEQLGVSIRTAFQDVQAYTTVAVPISERETARRESLETYERMLRTLLVGLTEARGLDQLPFIDRIVSVQGRIDKALGVETPAAAVDMTELQTVDEIDAAARQLVEEMDFLARNNMLGSS